MNNSQPTNGLPVGQALRMLRGRLGLTQNAAAKRAGSPGFRTVSHWETGNKTPSLKVVYQYLRGLGFDFHDLQEALDQHDGHPANGYGELTSRLQEVEQRLAALEQERSP